MKLRVVLFILILFESHTFFGQSYQSIFGQDSTQWNINHIIPDYIYTDILLAKGDTIINQTDYKKLSINNEYQGCLREDVNTGKLWFLSWNGSEYLIMDLSLEKGDSFDLICYQDTIQIHIDSVTNIEGRKVLISDFVLDSFYENEKLRFIEGVGPTNGIFLASHFGYYPSESYLLCSYLNSELNYSNELFNGECNILEVGISDININHEIKIYPNPIKDIVYFDFNNYPSDFKAILIFDLFGNLKYKEFINESLVEINLNSFGKGIYFYKISDQNDFIINSGKLIIKGN